jgi:hypothetical protein
VARLLVVMAAVVAGAAMAVGGRAIAQQQDFDKVQMDVVQVRPNVYMIVGAGGNTTIQFGDEGVIGRRYAVSRRSARSCSRPSSP